MQPQDPSSRDNKYANLRVKLATMTHAEIMALYNQTPESQRGLLNQVMRGMRMSGSFPAEEK